MRVARLVQIYIARSFLQWMAWRAFLITLVVNQIAGPLLGLAVWSAALPDSSEISSYYLSLFVVQLMTVSYENHTLSQGIYDGTFSHDLLKPQPPILPVIGENLAMRCWHLLLGLPVLAGVWVFAHPAFDLKLIVLAIPATLLAATLRFLFTYILALLAFWTQQADSAVGFAGIMIALLGGSAVPLSLFPDRMRGVVEVLPFQSMLGFPASIAAGTVEPSQMVIGYVMQIAWLCVACGGAAIVWRCGVRRYTAIGG